MIHQNLGIFSLFFFPSFKVLIFRVPYYKNNNRSHRSSLSVWYKYLYLPPKKQSPYNICDLSVTADFLRNCLTWHSNGSYQHPHFALKSSYTYCIGGFERGCYKTAFSKNILKNPFILEQQLGPTIKGTRYAHHSFYF